MFGIGGNSSSSKSSSEASSRDQSSSIGISTQDIAFEDLFAQLYGDAAGAAGKVAQNIPTFTGQAAQLFSGGMDFLNNLQGGNEGTDYLAGRVTGDSGILDRQIGTLTDKLSRGFENEILPMIGQDAINAGGFGGSRQGVAEGIAAGRFGEELTSGITSLITADQAARDTAATTLAGDRIAAAQVGTSALDSVLGLAETGATADMIPSNILSQIIGTPTVLTNSVSTSQSSGESKATSKSKSKSGGFSFGGS